MDFILLISIGTVLLGFAIMLSGHVAPRFRSEGRRPGPTAEQPLNSDPVVAPVVRAPAGRHWSRVVDIVQTSLDRAQTVRTAHLAALAQVEAAEYDLGRLAGELGVMMALPARIVVGRRVQPASAHREGSQRLAA